MSTSVSDHQRGKGPGNSGKPPTSKFSNASKGGDYEDVDSWRNQPQQQQHQGYGQASDPYMPAYYGFQQQQQYQAPFGVNENGPWSTNGGEQMGFLGGGNYASQGMHDSQGGHYGGDGMFSGGGGGNGGFNNFGGGGGGPGFGYGYGNGDYSTWGGPQPRKHYDDYYGGSRDGMYGDERSVKMMEQGMGGLSLRDGASEKELKEMMGGGGGGSKKTTWASIASQPAKPQTSSKKKPGMPPPPIIPGAWESKNGAVAKAPIAAPVQAPHPPPAWERPKIPPPQPGPPIQQQPPPQNAPPGERENQRGGPRGGGYQQQQMGGYMPPQHGHGHGHGHDGHGHGHGHGHGPPPPPPSQHSYNQQHSYSQHSHQSHPPPQQAPPPPPPPQQKANSNNAGSAASPANYAGDKELENLKKADYNPGTFDLSAEEARFFVIKSYSEDDIHRSIKYEIWCSTEHGNRRLDQAWKERDGKGPLFLLFSVNGSGHFCGMAQMMSHVDYNASSSVWSQDKWKGQFKVKWIYVKDVPNSQLRNIRLENNENKPVTNSRDTQEVPHDKGKQVLKIIHTYPHTTSIFDDFTHYEKRQEEEDQRRTVVQQQPPPPPHQMHERNEHGGGGPGPGPGGYGGRGRGGYHGNHHGMDGGNVGHGGGHFGGRGRGGDRDFGAGRGGENHRDFRDHGDRMDNRNHDHQQQRGGMDRGGEHFNGRGDGGHRDFYPRDRDHPRGGMRGGGRGGHHQMRN